MSIPTHYAATLVVDDFGIKYGTKEDANHLLDTLKKVYQITEDWSGTKYVGLTIDINRQKRTLAISIPGYVDRALKRFNVTKLDRDTHSPLIFPPIRYGQKYQKPKPEDTTPRVGPEQKKFIQQVIGTFLFYARAIDNTMLLGLNKLGIQQAQPTEQTMEDVHRFLQYCATIPLPQLNSKLQT